MFEHIKHITADIQGSLRARRQPPRTQSELPRIRNNTEGFTKDEAQEKLEATMGVFARFRRTASLKEVTLPPIRRIKPLTFTNLFGAARKDSGIICGPVEECTPGYEMSGGLGFPPCLATPAGVIKRKPITPSLSAFKVCEVAKFDAQAPRTDPDLMCLAKSVLKHRYTTKFDMEGFEPAEGRLRCDYYFMWASDEELNRKVMEDIIWVRERYAQAGREEPDDNAVISWYLEEGDL